MEFKVKTRRLQLSFIPVLICLCLVILKYNFFYSRHIGLFDFIDKFTKGESTRIKHESLGRVAKKPEFADADRKWIVLLAFNNAYFDFFQNWYWYFRRLSLHLKIEIIAEDDLVYERLKTFESENVSITRGNILTVNDSVSMQHKPNDYMKLVSERPSQILHYLRNGNDVLYCDIDTIWLHDPTAYIKGDFDLWILTEHNRTRYNSGFMAIKSNERTIRLMERWYLELVMTVQSNQPALNMLLKNSNEIRLKLLHDKLFVTGPEFSRLNTEERKLVVVLHVIYDYGHDQKLSRIRAWNLWYSQAKVLKAGLRA